MHSTTQLIELGAIILGLGLLGAVAVRFSISPIPLYLLAGLAFGSGGVLPLTTSEEFVSIGAEVGSRGRDCSAAGSPCWPPR